MAESRPDLPASLLGSEQERLRAARWIRLNPDPKFLGALKQARAKERVRWIRVALDEAIEACSGAQVEDPARETSQEVDSDLRQAYEDGRRDGLRQALHEVSPIVGLARAAAEEEDPDGTQRQLERLRAVCSGLRGFLNATSPRELKEFDLSAVPQSMADCPPVEAPKGLIAAQGVSPLAVRGDRDLLELALRPVVVNAIEAVGGIGLSTPNSITISWGLEREKCWVAVIDRGPGIDRHLSPGVPGESSKQGHFGFGLATAYAAMASLGGQMDVDSNRHGGTTVLLEWAGAR